MKSRFKEVVVLAKASKQAIAIEEQSRVLGVTTAILHQWLAEFDLEDERDKLQAELEVPLTDLVSLDAATGEIVVTRPMPLSSLAKFKGPEGLTNITEELQCSAGALVLQIADAATMPLEAKELALLASALTALRNSFVPTSVNITPQAGLLAKLQAELKA